MSLGIAFKGPEGIVLAADSRVTIMAIKQLPPQPVPPGGVAPPSSVLLPATYDNAIKMLKVKGQDYVGAVTYGAGSIGQAAPRTASSFLPEFEASLSNAPRLTVQAFAQRLSDFFLQQWNAAAMPVVGATDMIFLIAGYDDENAAYGRVFEVAIPSSPTPREAIPVGVFGAVWGGQREVTDRIIQGFDPNLPIIAQDVLGIDPANRNPNLDQELKNRLTLPIPWQFLPLQDCVDLSIFLVRATITMQKWLVDVRGVGGAVDVATVTRTEGFKVVQQKQVAGWVATGTATVI
jgi:hypothetical protein